MPFFPKDYDQLISQTLRDLRANSNVTQLSPGAKARFMIDAFTREQVNQHALFDKNLMQAFLRWAEGKFLDFFGDIMQVPRLESTSASSDVDHLNFMFYVDSGTFGDINNGLDFTISEGTKAYTIDFNVQRSINDPNDRKQTTKRINYSLIDNVVCRANQSFAWGAIRADVEGKASDVPRDALRRHSFSSYTMSSRGLLKCTNKYAITNGRDREDDDSYRYRLLNAFKAKERANKIAVRLAALSVPGVADVTEVNVEQGPGTYSLYVEGVTAAVSPGLISSVMAAVEPVSAYGVRPFVLAPLPLGVEFVIYLRWRDNTTETDKVTIQQQVRSYIENALIGYGIGDKLNLEDIVSGVVSVNQKIVGIGLLRPGNFEEIYLHRASPDGDGTKKSLFVGNLIEPLYNERVMLETSTRFRGIQFL